MGNLFSVPIFFVLFRESLEAAIIVSVLLSMSEQIVKRSSSSLLDSPRQQDVKSSDTAVPSETSTIVTEGLPIFVPDTQEAHTQSQNQLLKKLRIQIMAGALSGLVVALAMCVARVVFVSN